MGDTKMIDDEDLDDYNEVDQDGKPVAKPNEGNEKSLEETPLDWSFNDD